MNKTGMISCLTALLFIAGCASLGIDRTERIRAAHPQWDQKTVENVAARQVQLGMTQDMVRMAMGKPWSVSGGGTDVTWGYGRIESCGYWGWPCEKLYYFVHFRDNKVVGTTGNKKMLGFQYL